MATNYIEIKSGIEAGDVVVTHGAYLIHSEHIFRNGTGAMGGIKM